MTVAAQKQETEFGPLDKAVTVTEMREVIGRVKVEYDIAKGVGYTADGTSRLRPEIVRDVYVMDVIAKNVLEYVSINPKSFQEWCKTVRPAGQGWRR